MSFGCAEVCARSSVLKRRKEEAIIFVMDTVPFKLSDMIIVEKMQFVYPINKLHLFY